MRQTINTPMMVPKGTRVRVMGKLPDGSQKIVEVMTAHDVMASTEGIPYTCYPAWVDTLKFLAGVALTVAVCVAMW